MAKRDYARIYDLLRRLGHTGTEDEIAERIVATRGSGVRTDGVAENYPCSAPRGSAEWRENRAQVVSIIVGCTVRIGRAACVMPDAGGVPYEPDAHADAEAVSEVVAAVRNCDWQGRIDAVEDILSFMNSEIVEVVVAAVKELQEDESEDVHLHAFYALCHLGADAEAVVPTLVEHLRGGDESLRDMALETLSNTEGYANAAAVPYLIEVLTEPNSDADNLVMATRALGFCGVDAEGAVPGLALGLTDEDHFVRVHSAAALAVIGPAAKAALPALVEVRRSDIHLDAVHALYRLGPDAREAVPALIGGLEQGDLKHRRADATILGSIGPAASEAAPALIEALPALYGSAFEALKSIGAATEGIAPVLVRMSQSEHSYDRRFAAEALVEIGAETDVAVAVLIDCLNDDNSRTSCLAARTLGEIGPRAESAVPALTAVLEDESEVVRDAAKAALERIVPIAAV